MHTKSAALLEAYCSSESLSFSGLEKFLGLVNLPRNALKEFKSQSIHLACENKKVNLEIIRLLLVSFDDSAKILMANERTLAEVLDEFLIEKIYYLDKNDDVEGLFDLILKADHHPDDEDVIFWMGQLDEENWFPLHTACANDDCPLSVVRLLMHANPGALRHFACLKTGDIWGVDCPNIEFPEGAVGGLPIHYLIMRQRNLDLEIVREMIEMYPECTVGPQGVSCSLPLLHCLLRNQHVESRFEDILRYVFDQTDRSVLRVEDVTGSTPFFIACASSHISLGTLRYIHDIRPDCVEDVNTNYYAVHAHYLLIEQDDNDGIDLRGRSEDDTLEIIAFLMEQHPGLFRMVSEHTGETALHVASQRGSVRFVEHIMDLYPDAVSCRNNRGGHLPVHLAAIYGNLEVIRHYCTRFPDIIHEPGNHGEVLIHYAAQRGHAETVEFLLSIDKSGATKFDSRSMLPIHLASYSYESNHDVIEVLCDVYPESINIRNGQDHRLPIEIALQQQAGNPLHFSNHATIDFLRDMMAYTRMSTHADELARIDIGGNTLLMRILSRAAPLSAVKLVMAAQPEAVTIPNQAGLYPIHNASMFGKPKTVRFFADAHPGVLELKCDRFQNPLHSACRSKNVEVVDCLLELAPDLLMEEDRKGFLPFHYLLMSGVSEHGGPSEFAWTESIFKTLTAYPDVLLGCGRD